MRDISCKIVRGDGTIATQTTISANVLPSTDDLQPAVDSDGTRFVVTSTVAAQGWANRVEAVTCAFLPGSGTVRFDERSDLGAGGSAVYLGTDICADYSGGSGISPRYFVSFTEQISNTFNLVNYGGYHAGSFFSTFASQCGTQSISVSGSPVVGQSVNFQFGGTLAGSVLGLPGYVPLNAYGCSCVLGVNQVGSFFGNSLTWTVPNSAAYVGLIGSKVKVRGILGRLRDAGRLDGVDLARLHAPIGLDVGSATHGEIAVSIVAELIAHRRRRLAGLRTMRLPLEEMVRIAGRKRGEGGEPPPA